MRDSTLLRDLFRSEMEDLVAPYLWTDTDFWTYLDDAQTQFCRLTGGLADAMTSSVTQVPFVTTSDWVDLSPKIMRIRGAYKQADGSPITIVNFEDLARMNLRFDGRIGTVKYLVTGMEENKGRLYPYPDAAGTIQLAVDRYPLVPITDEDQTLEVADQHGINLLMWVKFRAYNKQDAETLNVKRAAEFKLAFEAYCDDARMERDRAKHKTRIVAYGGL